MKTINEYICESKIGHPLWCEIALSMFKNVKSLNKDSISNMLDSFCDVEGRMKKFSDYLAEEYPKEYLAYQPNDDEFLDKGSTDKISNQISEFILKFII